MDDSNQQASQQINNGIPVQQGGASVSQTSPVGHVQKEQELMGHSDQDFRVEESVKPSEVEPKINPEVAEAGVEKVSHLPQLTPDDHKIGVKLAKESTPVSAQPSGMVRLPMTAEEAKRYAKSGDVTSSKRWFAALIEKVYMQLNKLKP